jgi:pilus assembly protein TadC
MRKTLTEHKSVIAVLGKIAREKNMSLMDLMREGIRNEIRRYAENERAREVVFDILKDFEPVPEDEWRSPAELAKFKRKQRCFARLMLDLKLKTPDNIEKDNSAVPSSAEIRVLEFEEYHA